MNPIGRQKQHFLPRFHIIPIIYIEVYNHIYIYINSKHTKNIAMNFLKSLTHQLPILSSTRNLQGPYVDPSFYVLRI